MVRLFYFTTAFLLLACGTSKRGQVRLSTTQDTTILYLEEGQTHFLKEEQFNITFDKVAEDSRCPEGVHCVWSGVALVDLTAVGIYTRPQPMQLASTLVTDKDYQPARVFNGYSIRMLALDPYPSASPARKPTEKYRVKVAVVKLNN